MFIATFFLSLKTPSGIDVNDLPKIIDDFVDKNYISNVKSGCSILISKDQDIIFNKSYGYSNTKKDRMATLDTLYDWGSITKILTHISIFQLYEQGKLDLYNTDINDYLGPKFFKRRRYKENITISNLFHHNAGWDETYIELFSKNLKSAPNLTKYLQNAEPYQFIPPNKYVGYSNYGVTVEGLIIEKVSGQSYVDYIHDHIFKVLGITNTSIDPSRNDVQNYNNLDIAQGYRKINPKYTSTGKPSTITAYPAGSASGSILNLALLFNALKPSPSGSTVSPLFSKPGTLDEFLNISYRQCEHCTGIAHGLWEGIYGGENGSTKISSLGHGGNTEYFSSNAEILPKEGWGVYVLTNLCSEVNITSGLPQLIFGRYNYTNLDADNTIDVTKNVYRTTRALHHGFLGVASNCSLTKAKNVEKGKIKLGKKIFSSISPNTYIATDSNDFNAQPLSFFDGGFYSEYSGFQNVSKSNAYWNISNLSIIGVDVLIQFIACFIGAYLYLKYSKTVTETVIWKRIDLFMATPLILPFVNVMELIIWAVQIDLISVGTMSLKVYNSMVIVLWFIYGLRALVIVLGIALSIYVLVMRKKNQYFPIRDIDESICDAKLELDGDELPRKRNSPTKKYVVGLYICAIVVIIFTIYLMAEMPPLYYPN